MDAAAGLFDRREEKEREREKNHLTKGTSIYCKCRRERLGMPATVLPPIVLITYFFLIIPVEIFEVWPGSSRDRILSTTNLIFVMNNVVIWPR